MTRPDAATRLPRWRGLAIAGLAWGGFALLAIALQGAGTTAWDEAALRLAQQWRATHPLVEAVMREFSSLGSTPVLTLFTVLAVGYLGCVGRPARAAAVGVAMIGGALAVTQLKTAFARARPDPAFAAMAQEGLSFPSGHASMSAVFYLTVGVLLAQRCSRWPERAFLLGAAITMTLLIGVTRVMLGVHWASDVLAGWAFGVGWAALWFQLAGQLREGRPGSRAGQAQT